MRRQHLSSLRSWTGAPENRHHVQDPKYVAKKVSEKSRNRRNHFFQAQRNTIGISCITATTPLKKSR
jgi:hypothetical protein